MKDVTIEITLRKISNSDKGVIFDDIPVNTKWSCNYENAKYKA